MKTHDFLQLLATHKNKSLLFEYAPGKFVGANYHITEVKNITVDSVDCGTGTDFWKETVVQLWESPQEMGKTNFMQAFKALAILKKVAAIKPMERGAEVKFEYGNSKFHTAQLRVKQYTFNERRLIINLTAEKTDCKAKESCGVAEPVTADSAQHSCTPNSGCC